MTTQSNYFAELNQLNVSEHLERKGGFAYLSWPYAVTQLRLADGSATWEVRRFDGKPYLSTELGVFVEVAVTVRGITLSQIHPVLDGRNRPILAPTAFDINTSLQRCLVKAIALHGIGLYIYAGEDLPNVATTAANDDAEQPKGPTTPRKSARRRTGEQVVVAAVAADATAVAGDSFEGCLCVDQRQVIERLLAEVGGDRDRLLAYFGVESLAHLRAIDYDRVVRSLEKRRTA